MKSKIVWTKPSDALIKTLLVIVFSAVFGGLYYIETYILTSIIN